MKLIKTKSGYAIPNSYFDIHKIMVSGQLALIFELDESRYISISEQKYAILKVSDKVTYIQTDDINYWLHYFDLNFNYRQFDIISSDKFLSNSIEYSKGIRILNRNIWEVVISFVLSQNNNIPNIMNMINKLCRNYGRELYPNYYSFPTYHELRKATIDDLESLSFGYRAEYVYDLIQITTNISVKQLFDSYDSLINIRGIGPKVASCIDLYGNHNLDSFPIDVHINRILEKHYPDGFDMKYKGVYQMFMFYYSLNKEV